MPVPGDASVTGGQDAGRAGRQIPQPEAAKRGGQVVVAEGGARDGWFALGGKPALTNADIQRARGDVIDAMTKEPIVALELTTGGQEAFAAAHAPDRRARRRERNPRERARVPLKHFVIVVDDRIASVPFIDFRQNPEGIDGATGMQISSALTKESARQLAALLNAGPLPDSFEPAG